MNTPADQSISIHIILPGFNIFQSQQCEGGRASRLCNLHSHRIRMLQLDASIGSPCPGPNSYPVLFAQPPFPVLACCSLAPNFTNVFHFLWCLPLQAANTSCMRTSKLTGRPGRLRPTGKPLASCMVDIVHILLRNVGWCSGTSGSMLAISPGSSLLD